MPEETTMGGTKKEAEGAVEKEGLDRETSETEQGSGGEEWDRGRLESELEKARLEVAEGRERLLRVAAESENTHRRSEQDAIQARKFALERFAMELLPVRDSLERAQAVERSGAASAMEALFAGVDLTLQLMDSVLEKFAITVVNPVGARFNPDQQQAMTMVESDAVPANHVVEVVQKGFLLNDRLLRPALVVVAKAKS